MDGDIVYNIRLLLNEIFNRDHYNVPLLDGEKCSYCGKRIEVKKKSLITKKYKYLEVVDRSEVIDCDPSIGEQKKRLKRYHKLCWVKVIGINLPIKNLLQSNDNYI